MSELETQGTSLIEELSRLDRLKTEIADTEKLLVILNEDYAATGTRARGLFTSIQSVLATFTLPMPEPVEPVQPDNVSVLPPVPPTAQPVTPTPSPAPTVVPPESDAVPSPGVEVITETETPIDLTDPALDPDDSFLNEPDPAPTPVEPDPATDSAVEDTGETVPPKGIP